jgi:hypothetical protein
VKRIRAKAVMNINWLKSVLKMLTSKSIESIVSECEFIDKSHDSQAIGSVENESPYLKKREF